MASSSFDTKENGEIREGFLCPICMQDLGTVYQLQQHFEEAHNSEEDHHVLQSFKGSFLSYFSTWINILNLLLFQNFWVKQKRF